MYKGITNPIQASYKTVEKDVLLLKREELIIFTC